jgi:hypothetical protein
MGRATIISIAAIGTPVSGPHTGVIHPVSGARTGNLANEAHRAQAGFRLVFRSGQFFLAMNSVLHWPSSRPMENLISSPVS